MESVLNHSSRSRTSLRLAALLLWAGACVFLALMVKRHGVEGLYERLGEGRSGAAIFVGAYVASCVFLLPGGILSAAAGALFGLTWGIVYVSLGVTLGACSAFLVGRYLIRDLVSARIASHPRLLRLDEALEKHGWKVVLLTRLVIFVPFRLSNYAFSVTRVHFLPYAVCTWIGTLPTAAFYVSAGSFAGDAIRGDWAKVLRFWPINLFALAAFGALILLIRKIVKSSSVLGDEEQPI